MKYITTIGLWLVLAFCHDSGNPHFVFPVESEPSFNLDLEYGSGKGSIQNNFLPSIIEVANGYCFESRDRFTQDYGPRFSLCFQGDFTTKQQLASVAASLISPGREQAYPRFLLENELGTVSFSFETESSLKRFWKNSPPEEYIVLDSNISKSLGIGSHSFLAQEVVDMSKQYGLPYWNYYGGNECFFFFSPWEIDIPANSRNILKIEIDCEKLKPKIKEFKRHVQETNQENLDHCKNSKVELTEKFSHSESKLGRFIEFYNPENEPICWNQLVWKNKDDSLSTYIPKPSFLFPQSTVLFSDPSSKLEGMNLGDVFSWSDYFSAKIEFIEIENSFPQALSGYKWEDEFFTDQKRAKPCLKQKYSYQTEERFCGSPGSNSDQDEYPVKHCMPSDIDLLEINAVGIQDGYGFVDARDKYLELIWKGRAEELQCNLSSLSLVIGEERIPLVAEERMIKNGELFLISLSKKIADSSILIPRNIYRLSYSKEIRLETLGDLNETKIIYSPNRSFTSIPIQIATKDADSSLYSLVSHNTDINTIWIHHPRIDYLDWNRGFRNYMSPGRSHESNFDVSHYPSITEVLWAGSYQNGISVSTDRFIEWENLHSSKGSFYLSLFYPLHPARNQIYLLPRTSGINFVTSKPMTCFTRVDGFYISSFSLYQDSLRIDVLDEWGQIQETNYLDTKLYGKNLTKDKYRASAIKSFRIEDWSTSRESFSDCMGHVAASPGKRNVPITEEYKEGN